MNFKKNFIISLCALFFMILLVPSKVDALSITFPEYHVEIEINEDSTMEVTERLIQKFNGVGHGVRRDVTLESESQKELCRQNPELTCGGFDELIIIGAYDKFGNQLDDSDGFQTYKIEDESGSEYLRFEWEIWPDGEFLQDEIVEWSVKYKILGGIQWLDSGEISGDLGKNVPYLYWNAIPEDKSGTVDKASVKLVFPDGVEVSGDKLITYTDYSSTYKISGNELELTLDTILPSFSNYTVAYEFGEDDLIRPATFQYKVKTFMLDAEVWSDGIQYAKGTSGEIRSVPAGKNTFVFKATGFKDKSVEVQLNSGEVTSVEIEMQRTAIMQIVYYLNIILMLVACCLFPFIAGFPIFRYYQKGKDKNMPKTIIPEFKPPKGVHPYLLGSIKDEKVDKKDIVGSIIDLAYRGYIKIEEITKGKDYKLIKLEGKKGAEPLDSIELEIMDAIFASGSETNTKSMRSTFPYKYSKIVSKIYSEMVDKKYFDHNPKNVRSTYLGVGIVLLILGTVSFVTLSTFLSGFLNMVVVFILGIALAFMGLVMIPVSLYMPSKTILGSKVLADVLGFKMYLHTAERFRLQKLGPDEFERYLSYAIVFGIEKEWAKKFEGIYEGNPDWFVGSNNTVFDAVLLSSLANDFSNAATVAATPVPSSSSSSGGGWSGGGGSFGGFSGGGGGGGSAGGW